MFFGAPSREWLAKTIPPFETIVIVVNMVFLWILLIPKIITSFHGAQRNLFYALAVVLLMAPIWKEFSFHDGFMDEYILFFALTAMAMFLLKMPVAYAAALCIGILMHRGELFFAAAQGLIIIHAIYKVRAFRRHYRRWLAAAIFPLLFFVFLQMINNPEAAINAIRESGDEVVLSYGDKYIDANIRAGSTAIFFYWDALNLLSAWFLTAVCVFGGVPLLLSGLLPLLLKKLNLQIGDSQTSLRWFDFTFPLIAVCSVLPILIIASDWGRLLLWIWIPLFFVVVYYVHFACPVTGVKTKIHNNSHKKTKTLPIILLLLAWLFAGLPFMGAHLGTPFVFPQYQYLVPGITTHSVGQWLAIKLAQLQNAALFPINLPAKNNINLLRYFNKNISETQSGLLFPKNPKNALWGHRIVFYEKSVVRIEIVHGITSQPPFKVTILGWGEVPISQQSPGITTWEFITPPGGIAAIEIRLQDNTEAVEVTSILLDMKEI